MVTISQNLWNLLFSWLSGKECMLPEGCTPPPAGLISYLAIVAVVTVIIHQRDKIIKGKSDFLDVLWGLLDLI